MTKKEDSAEKAIRDIRRATRRRYSAGVGDESWSTNPPKGDTNAMCDVREESTIGSATVAITIWTPA